MLFGVKQHANLLRRLVFSLTTFLTTNSPYHIKIGVVWAVYVSGGIPVVNVSNSFKQLSLLLNKRFPFLKIPIDKQIPIVSEKLKLTKSRHEQWVWTLLGSVWCITFSAVLEVFAIVGKQSVFPVFTLSICNYPLKGSLVASLSFRPEIIVDKDIEMQMNNSTGV